MELKINYPPDFAVRWGYGKAYPAYIERLLKKDSANYEVFLDTMLSYKESFDSISYDKPDDSSQPYYSNPWFPPLDGAALYTMIASRRPKTIIEIGSGNSTKFARRAIRDHNLDTKIISIDPVPRTEIDSISDVIIRQPLEAIDLSVFDELTAKDLVFFDGSHRSFQNSDVTVFFIEVLPRLPEGIVVGIHDIFWPQDYPLAWKERLYNEQYLLGAFMVGQAERFQCVFPCHYSALFYRKRIEKVFEGEMLTRWLGEKKPINGGILFFEKHRTI